MNDLVAAFSHVASTLDRMGIDYVVVGSVAASNWGSIRTTIDLDLVLTVQQTDADSIIEMLTTDGFYVPTSNAITALRDSGSFNLLDPMTGAKIDLFVVPIDDEFERMRLARRESASVLGVDSWVATAEDLILAKLRWRTESDSERQWRDCLELAAVNDLDVDHLRRWADHLGIADDLERLLATIPD